MSFLDTLRGSISDAVDAAKRTLFGTSPRELALGEVNRVVSVLVGLRPKALEMQARQDATAKAFVDVYNKHLYNVRQLLQGLCEADKGFRVKVPSDIGFKGLPCVIRVSRAEWDRSVRRVGAKASGESGLGAVFVPVIIALAVVSVGAVGTSYLLTAEGRQRMAMARQSADTASALARAVAEGKVNPQDAKALIDSLPAPPGPSGGLFDSIGKTAVLGAVGVGGALFLLSKLSASGRRLAGIDRTLQPVIRQESDGRFRVAIKRDGEMTYGPYYVSSRAEARATIDKFLKAGQQFVEAPLTRLIDEAEDARGETRRLRLSGGGRRYAQALQREREAVLAVRRYEAAEGLPRTYDRADVPGEDDVQRAIEAARRPHLDGADFSAPRRGKRAR